MLGAMGAGAYVFMRMDEEIRQRIEARFAEKYPNLKVRIRSARLVPGEGIEIRGLSLSDPKTAGPHARLADIDEMFLACSTDLGDLAQGEPPLKQVTVHRLSVHAARQPDGAWGAAKLWPIPKFGKRVPLNIQNATIEIVEPQRHPATTLTIRDINFTVAPQSGAEKEIDAPCELQGTATADHLQRLAISARMDPVSHRWSAHGALDALSISPELLAVLPDELAALVPALRPIHGEGRIDFQVWGDPNAPQPIVFQASAELIGGRLDDARLPYPLADLHVKMSVDNSGFVLEELTARNGPTTLRVTGRSEGISTSSPMVWSVEGKHLQLTRQWAEMLPDALKTEWQHFQPAGEIDASIRLAFDGHQWRPLSASADLLDASFSHHKFPYRLEHGSGTLRLEQDRLKVKSSAYAGAERVEIDGDLNHPGPHFTGWVQLKGNGIPMDRSLWAALPDKSREVFSSLNPYGTFNFVMLMTRDNPAVDRVNQHLVLTLNRCAIKYEKFPYPIGSICGTVEMIDGRWTLHSLQGNNHSGLIRCEGDFSPLADGSRLHLTFKGNDVQLDDELRDALPPGQRHVWNSVKPRGKINLTTDVTFLSGQKNVEIVLHAEPVGDTVNIEPRAFAYRLDKLQGGFDYRDGHVQFDKLRALHDRTAVTAGGSCDFLPDGSWKFQLKRLNVDRLHGDRDLIAALPTKLRKTITELSPGGPINLRGDVSLAGSGDPEAPVASAWDIDLDLQQGNINCGTVKLDNIFGGVHLTGACDGKRVQSRGELAIDSLTYKDFQVTEVRGPLWFDDERVLLGAEAEQRSHGRGGGGVSGKIYGGVLLGAVAVSLQTTPRFSVNATLSDADLERFAGENIPGKHKLKGKVQATMEVSGTTAGTHTLSGRGHVHLRDADIYELPVMVALLKILSIRSPDSTAFISSDVDYRIDGEHFYFDRIVLAGDAISLFGKGEMNVEGDIKMAFHSLVGRPELQLPVIKTVLGQASKQIMLIHVDGTLASPKTTTEVLPSINQALQALQGEGITPLPPVGAGGISRDQGPGARGQ